MGTPRGSTPKPRERTDMSRPRVRASRMRSISASTNWFFSMLNRHMCSGSPVVADCIFTKSIGDWVPSPRGSSALANSSPAFFAIWRSCLMGISRSA